MEGSLCAVPRVCVVGGWFGWECGMFWFGVWFGVWLLIACRLLWFSSTLLRIIRLRRFTLVLRMLWLMAWLCSGMFQVPSWFAWVVVLTNLLLALLFFGSRRTSRMITPTTLHCDAWCLLPASMYYTQFLALILCEMNCMHSHCSNLALRYNI